MIILNNPENIPTIHIIIPIINISLDIRFNPFKYCNKRGPDKNRNVIPARPNNNSIPIAAP
ncbi:MAG: hypothetical protein WD512_11240 [Candidatus Paceibacterota bacterium]